MSASFLVVCVVAFAIFLKFISKPVKANIPFVTSYTTEGQVILRVHACGHACMCTVDDTDEGDFWSLYNVFIDSMEGVQCVIVLLTFD